MRKVILRDRRKIPPFNEPARELSVLTKPLWLHQRDILASYTTEEYEVDSLSQVSPDRQEMLVYRDNLYFDARFLEDFLTRAKASGKACRVAFDRDDPAIMGQARYLQRGIRREGPYYVADLWYYPYGIDPVVRPLVMDTEAREVGFYHIPTHMSNQYGDLVYDLPTKPFLSIEHWLQILHANIDFGIFAIGARFEQEAERDLLLNLKLLWRGLLERKQILQTSSLVEVGRNCSIDPTAIIQGPAFIGNNVSIGPGTVIGNCYIGDNVTIDQGCQLMLSVVGDGSFLPFRAALYRTVLMEDCMVAQNSCLQMCVVGRGSFIGAGNTFTDFNLVDKPIRSHFRGGLEDTGMTALGSAVGHNVRIGSGMIVFPARMIDSDVVLFASKERRVIRKNVRWEDSDHLNLENGERIHPRRYPRE
jgi:UDP-N-acetylglucosamine diphosphorylase / glucose-1-phosphate thymidylyltransferase / UDP-N-acetylgalactosamine diphosphorylase / glucosamine-1-phosphate N-acetyltransferase / galactosamine-1-phosphate N-acetyltransferase